jgi:hypothetical protein
VLEHALHDGRREARVAAEALGAALARDPHGQLAGLVDHDQETALGAGDLDRRVDDVQQEMLEVARLRDAPDRLEQHVDRAAVELRGRVGAAGLGARGPGRARLRSSVGPRPIAAFAVPARRILFLAEEHRRLV